jgi:hypothetical protein
MEGINHMKKFPDIKEEIKAQLDKVNYDGDLSDLGNEIGIVIGKHLDKDNTIEDFIRGLRHGKSLTDGTHDKAYPSM